jgi:hypothetical protein
MRGIHRFISIVLCSVLFVQCQKEISYIGTPDPGQVVPSNPITANLQGNVVDENGLAANNVSIKVGAKTASTDAKGYFRINDAPLDKNVALVTVEKTGYFKTFRCFSATSGTNQVVIKLIRKTLSGNVDAATGGEVSLSNGTKITLPASGVVKASDNSSYTGSINVYAAYIDPTTPDILDRVPGSFMANDKDGQRVLLTSYGMMAVELESGAGEKLQIKQGSSATLSSPIPAAAQASAPATIALWYVDEATGLWKEEGSATRQGTNYIGSVQHFTYWNCDIRVPTINLKALLKNADGQPLVNASIIIKPTSGGYYNTAHGYTDSLGQINGPVPANMELMLEVMDPCGSVVYTKTIGPFSQNTDLGTLTISTTGSSIVTVKGRLTDCSGVNVTKGYAIVAVGNYFHYAKVDASGNFSTNFVVCNTSANVSVLGIDENSQQQGTTVSMTMATPVTDAGNLTACGTSSLQFINYTYDGNNYSIISSASDSLVAYTSIPTQGTTYRTAISGSHNNSYFSFAFSSNGAVAGTYPLTYISLNNTGSNTNNNVTGLNVVITSFPQIIGDFYIGSINGSFTDSQNVSHTLNCNFKVRRNY